MVDFTLAQIEGAQSGPPSGGGQRPVQQPTPSAAGAAINLFSQVMPTAQQFQQRAQARQEREIAGAVERFSQDQLRLAEAVDSGQMSSQEARMRMRANFSRAISDNPMMMDDLSSAQKQIIGTSGLGKVAAEGTEAEQRQQAVINSAAQAGRVTADMTEAQAQEMANEWQRFKVAQDDLSRRQAELTFRRGQVGLQTDVQSLETGRINQQRARLGLQNDRDERQAMNDLGIMADAYYPLFRHEIEGIQERLQNGEIDEVAASQELEGAMADIRQVVGSVGAAAGSAYIDNMTAGFDRTYELAKKTISGELESDILSTQLDKQMAKLHLNLMGDPETASVVATSRLLDGALVDTLLAAPTTQSVVRSMQRLGAEGKSPDPTDDTSQYGLRVLRENMREDVQGSAVIDEPHHRQIETGVNQVLSGINAYQSAIEDPSELNDVVEFISSDDFRNFMRMEDVTISSEAAAGASQVFQQQYEQEVLPLIRDEWRRAEAEMGALPASGFLGTTGDPQPVSSVIEPVFTGGGLSFRALTDNPRARNKARDLNRSIAPIVNRNIRTAAHLEMSDDYEKYYQEHYAPLFSAEEAEEE